jgi:hypothetical protein
MFDTLHVELSTFILLTTGLNIFHLDNGANGTHYCVSMATLNGFVLLTATVHDEYSGSELLRFHDNNGFARAPQCYVMCTLPILFPSPLGSRLYCVLCALSWSLVTTSWRGGCCSA